MLRVIFVILASFAGLPAAAQDSGGLPVRQQNVTLGQIDANRGCQMSSTSVTVGVNKATGTGSAAQQKLATSGGTQQPGCKPLVSTGVVAGINLGLGRNSSAGQTIDATGPAGALSTTNFTRGVNTGFGAGSAANQRISNQTGR